MMYKVYCDGYILHDPRQDDPGCLVVNGKVKKTANRADSFTFTVYPQNGNAGRIRKMISKIEVTKDGETIFVGRPVSCSEGWEGQKAWQCEGVFALLNDTIVRPYSYTGSVSGYLQMLVDQHNASSESWKRFALRTVTVTDPNDTIVRSNTDYTPTMKELLDKTVGHMGGYLVATPGESAIMLDYLADSTEGTEQAIVIAKNLIDFKRDQDGTKVATALIPLGAKDEETGRRVTIASVNGGYDYIVDGTAASEYGLIFATEKWDDVTIPANLLRKARARLQEMGSCVPRITLTAVDLSIIDQSIEPIRLLDYVAVTDGAHQATGRYLVTERVYNISSPENDRITFGGEQKTISGETARNRQEAAAESEQAYADSRGAVEDAVARATSRITGESGGHVKFKYDDQTGELEQILIMDTHDESTAMKIWRWNLSGLGYSGDGGLHYATAITAEGQIVADFITTGMLSAGLIKTGILTDDLTNPHFYFNLATGELSADFGTLKLDGSNVATEPSVATSISLAERGILLSVSRTYSTKAELESAEDALEESIVTVASTVQVNADKIALVVSESGGQYGIRAASIVTAINAAGSGVEISADHISLNGAVTANNYFKINIDGSMEATAGTIGGWSISATELSHEATAGYQHTYTIFDVAEIRSVLLGYQDEQETLESKPYLDLDGDGHLTYFDVYLARMAILGYIPNTVEQSTIRLNPTSGYGAFSAKTASGEGFNAGSFGVYGKTVIGENLLIEALDGSTVINASSSSGAVTALVTQQGDLAMTGDVTETSNTSGSGAATLQSGAWATVAQLQIPAGTWLVTAACQFGSQASGMRKAILAGSQSGTTPIDFFGASTECHGQSGYEPTASMSVVRTANSGWTAYLRAVQDSGAAETAVGNIRAVRIC